MGKRAGWGLFQSVLVIALAGCSAEDDDPGSTKPYLAPPPNGVPVSEASACDALRQAESQRWNALGCGALTRPPCPGYLRKGSPECLAYDEGTVSGCVNFIAGLDCQELNDFECVVKAIANSAPSGC